MKLHVTCCFIPGELNKLLIIGRPFDCRVLPIRTRLVDLTSATTVCNTPPPHPLKAVTFGGAVSTFIGGKALVCGGRFKLNDSSVVTTRRECFIFDGCSGGWSRGPDLPEGREGARGVMLDEKRWWILGGELQNEGVDAVMPTQNVAK